MAPPRVVLLDDLRIDLARQQVERDGKVLDVAGLSFQLLRFLIGQGDRVVGFDELIERVWAPAIVNEETVTQRVKLLRQGLGDDGRRPRYVRSVRGQGYQLCSMPREEAIVAQATPSRRRTPLVVGLVAAGVVALGIVAALLQRPEVVPVGDPRMERAAYYAAIGQADNNERAIALYDDVLRGEPGNVMAELGLSRALSASVCLYNADPQAAQRAKDIAERVIGRDSANGAAHNALAYAHDCLGDVDAAIVEYERAVALDPTARTGALASAANLYVERGRLADALASNIAVERSGARPRFLDLQIARNLDLLGFPAAAERRLAKIFELYPDNVFGNVAYPRFLYTQGRFAEADATLAVAMKRPLHPQLYLLAGELALVRGDRRRAESLFVQAAALRPHQSRPRALVALYADAPDIAAAGSRADLIATQAAGHDADAWIDVALLRGSERAAAIDALHHAVAAGFRDAPWLRVSPLFRPIANDPAFAGVVDSIGRAVALERARVLASPWLPPDLLNASSAAP